MTKQARAGGALSALRRGADLLAAAEAMGRWARAAAALGREAAVLTMTAKHEALSTEVALALAAVARGEAVSRGEAEAMQAALRSSQQLALEQADRLPAEASEQALQAVASRVTLAQDRAAAAADALAEDERAAAARAAARVARVRSALLAADSAVIGACVRRWRERAGAAAAAALSASRLRLPRLLLLRSIVAAESAAALRAAVRGWQVAAVAMGVNERTRRCAEAVGYAEALLFTQALSKLVAVLRHQRLAAMSGALRAWLLALIALETRAVREVPGAVSRLLAPLLQAAEDSHSAARLSDVAAHSAEADAAAAVACSGAVAAAAEAARGAAAAEAAAARREVAATSQWGGALLLANVMRGRMRALCTEALRSWYDAALLQQQQPGVWREGESSQGWHEELSREEEEEELYEGILPPQPPPNGQGS